MEEKVFQPLVCTAALQLLFESHVESCRDVADIVKVGVVKSRLPTHFLCLPFYLGVTGLPCRHGLNCHEDPCKKERAWPRQGFHATARVGGGSGGPDAKPIVATTGTVEKRDQPDFFHPPASDDRRGC